MLPSATELQALLDKCLPLTVLKELQGEIPVELAIYKAQALLYLDCSEEAAPLLDSIIEQSQGDELARAKRYLSQILLRRYQIDEAIFAAQAAIQASKLPEMRAHAMMELVAGYSRKTCRQLAENALRDAKALVGPSDPVLLLGEANFLLEMDERLAARAVYDRLAECTVPWAGFYANAGRSTVALLLGDFDEARNYSDVCRQTSDEMIWPFYTLAHLAIIDEDGPRLEEILNEITKRSPRANALSPLQGVLTRLQKRQAAGEARRKRLKAFPTIVQKRNYCGPSTIDLVLRFWKASEEFTDDQIAAYVKLPHGGTPIYRMQEFFHLVGFDTIRCSAPVNKLKQLVDAGYPTIIVEEFPDNSHVSIVIGYDESEHVIEFQDPMTHQVIAFPEEAVNRLRRTYLDSAIIAFPHGKGCEKELALLGFFDEPAIIWTDQADREMERGALQEVTTLMERATQRLPTHQLSWILWLSAELEIWRRNTSRPSSSSFGLSAPYNKNRQHPSEDRGPYYSILQRARELYPDAKFVYSFSGFGALQNGDAKSALTAFKHASEIDPADSRNFAAMAECNFMLRDTDHAFEMAQEALKRNPILAVNNLWIGRCLAFKNDEKSEHYIRCALELAPNWWMAHQAIADVHLFKRDFSSAHRELDLALALDSQQPQVRIQRAVLASLEGFHAYAIMELEDTLKKSKRLPLYAEYNARQGLCREYFSRRQYNLARKHIEKLIRVWPDDPWALQFFAATVSEQIPRGRYRRTQAAGRIRRLYAPAIKANKGTTWIVNDYVNYLSRFEAIKPIVDEIAHLRASYPENKGLLGLHARWMSRVDKRVATQLMLEAVNTPGGIRDADDLYGAVQIILNGLGVESAEQSLLSAPIPEKTPPLIERQRALGLALALNPKEQSARAGALLKLVIENNPRDSYALLRLGDIATDSAEREGLYRRALRFAPAWPFVRAYFANYLTDTGRAREALGFTAGFKNDSSDMMIANGRALFALGRHDEAALVYRSAIAGIERPESWLYNNLWMAESRSGDHRAALITGRKALNLFPREVRWYSLVATSLRNMGRFRASARMIQRGLAVGLKWPAYLESQYEAAWAQGHYRSALRWEEELAKWEKPAGEKYLTRAEERHLRVLLKLRREKQARLIVEGKPWLNSAEAWYTPIWISMESGAWDIAREFSERALALDPQNFAGMFGRAEALAEADHLDEAITALNALRKTHPYEHNSYEKLALHHALQGELDEAMELAERGVLLGSFCPFAWATRGYICFLKGQWEAARTDLEIGWRRANFSNQRENYAFWWVLASLQNRPVVSLYRKIEAWREARVSWRRAQFDQISKQLNQSVNARFRYSLLSSRSYRKIKNVLNSFR